LQDCGGETETKPFPQNLLLYFLKKIHTPSMFGTAFSTNSINFF
jgi:hypothetical protein